jgi:hypothetical protein
MAVETTRSHPDITTRFMKLAEEWRQETAVISSSTEIAMHPAYQQIIGLGPAAVPLILQELEKRPGHWFWALKAITGADPVKPEDRGRVSRMTRAWLEWGRAEGYVW